ncbi:hypothetical protein EHP00_1925 [Ecytonucleospora hepatopenaei]|uniref:ISXO2-like transposase domain-containing protein n=1 Tax=Ecytonucleospora hepatopenaei TaxID=646526 RepID=A0A1W0E8C6_9MICR|nr:hypothetical protein EHP00_1925 [Ecytonucleospora hepatopenaei]
MVFQLKLVDQGSLFWPKFCHREKICFFTPIMALSKKQTLRNFIDLKLNKCIVCNSNVRFKSSTSFETICTWKYCKNKTSVFLNSIFKNFKKGVEELINLFELLFSAVNLRAISRIMPYSYSKLKFFVSKTNQYVKSHNDRFLDTIGGEGIIVEIDDSKFGKRKYNRGHKVDGVWVLGMVEKTADRRIVLIPVKDRNSNTLEALIKRHVAPESIIFTDQW